MRSHPVYEQASQGRRLRFLANVDPIDFHRSIENLDVEETLFLVNSKTFTTAETILNAKSCRKWLLEQYSKLNVTDEGLIVSSHMCACSTNIPETSKFGIADKNVFGFWDFVGGRFSVWSAIGILPLSIQFGYEVAQEFLRGGHAIDTHLLTEKNIEVSPYIDSEKHTPFIGLDWVLPHIHPEVKCQSHRALLSGPVKVRPPHPAAGHGKQREAHQPEWGSGGIRDRRGQLRVAGH